MFNNSLTLISSHVVESQNMPDKFKSRSNALKKILLSVILISCAISLITVTKMYLEAENSMVQSYGSFYLNRYLSCFHRDAPRTVSMKRNYRVISNYLHASKVFKCNETITYTTHCDYSGLKNLLPLLNRWQGPVSVAVYAPGSNFQKAVKAITYLRKCQDTSYLVYNFATFHIIYDIQHMPPNGKNLPFWPNEIVEYDRSFDCSMADPSEIFAKSNYSLVNNLSYPVNVARNVARSTATSHFVFASDIELYPSPGLIPDFMEMIGNQAVRPKNPVVYVNNIFEIDEKVKNLPQTKTDLSRLWKSNKVIPFHSNTCAKCHRIPGANEWWDNLNEKEMKTFVVGKRTGAFYRWEPFFIGTHNDPIYDERLTWEGQSDKMTQAYIMCVQNYEFHVLNNAFLIHKPGIKPAESEEEKRARRERTKNQTNWIKNELLQQYDRLYGTREGCQLLK